MEIHQHETFRPSIKGLIKINKPDQPIRPVVNRRSAPAYKLSKLFTNKINHLIPLPNAFIIKNTQDSIQDIKDTPMLPHFSLASLDITNLYTNIPVKRQENILAGMMKRKLVDPKTQQEILKWWDVITKQNYFTYDKDIIIQHDGLAMGTPSLGLFAEIFLQHIEHLHLAHLAHKHSIMNYCRCVDGILLIFDSNRTNMQTILNDFNAMRPKLQITAEAERDRTLNCLYISIHRSPHKHQNRHIQKTRLHRHHHPLQLQPSHTPQILGSQVPVQ